MEERFEEYSFFKTNNDYLSEMKEALRGNKKSSLAINLLFWLVKTCFFVGIFLFVYSLFLINRSDYPFLTQIIIALVLLLISLFFYGPLKISVCKNAINMVKNTKPSFKDCGYGFKKYGRSVKYGILLFISYIFNLILLIFPFVIKYINCQFVGYILAENEDIKVSDAFKLSKNYMHGFKNKFLKIYIYFIPKFLLCFATLYIYSLWLRPQFNTFVYCLYQDVKE